MVHTKRAVASENIFNRTVGRAEDIGMKVNIKKTQMLLISDAISFKPSAYITTTTGEEIRSREEEMKLLGFTFDSSPTARAHVSALVKKLRRRFWILRHLKEFGFNEKELVQVYCAQVRSVADFCSVVYHSLLTQEQSDLIERQQYQALKCIFGPVESYRALLERSGVERLSDRRLKAVEKFAGKCLVSRFREWFPLNDPERKTRKTKKYKELFARCDRLRKTPIYFMRRLLNSLETV